MRRFFTPFLLAILFFLPAHIYSQARPAIAWQKCIGGTGDDQANDVLLNTDGTMVIAGSSKSNDGNVTGHHGALTSSDAWVAKLDANGNVLWQRSVGGSLNDYFSTVIKSSDGNYICVGATESNDGDLNFNNGGYDCLVVKIKAADGSIIWTRNFGGTQKDVAADAVATSDSGIAVAGTIFSFDGDITSKLWGATDSDGWVFKLNNAGDMLWEKALDYDSLLNDQGFNIIEMPGNKLVAYVSGTRHSLRYIWPFQYFIDVHPGVLYQIDNNTGTLESKIGTTSGYSNFSLCKGTNSWYYSFIDQVHNDLEHCSTFTGSTGSASFGTTNMSSWFINQNINPCYTRNIEEPAPTHGVAYTPGFNDQNYIVAGTYKYSENTVMGYLYFPSGGSAAYGGADFSGFTYFNSVKTFPDGLTFLVAGHTNSNTTDVSGNHGGYDCWVVKLAALNTIKGNVFVDANNDGIMNNDERPFDNARITATNQNRNLSFSAVSYGGRYAISLDTGIYNITAVSNRPYYNIAPGAITRAYSTYRNIDSINFPVTAIPGIKDYKTYLSAGVARPGFQQQYDIIFANQGTLNSPLVQGIFIKDSRLQYAGTSASSGTITTSGDTLTWTGNLPPDGSIHLYAALTVPAIPAIQLGDIISSSAYIDSVADTVPNNNVSEWRQAVTGSYDPNDKKESHGGFIHPLELATEKKLTYTIRFQNTGTDTAFNIVIRDTLDNKLDGGSIEMVDASHSYSLAIKNNKYLTWTFSNIQLVDSLHNEPLSHGFISYRVQPAGAIFTGDTIRNTAAIFFDYNLPVITNTDITIVKADSCIWTGAVSTAWENPQNWMNNKVPGKGNDVYINAGLPRYPEVNADATCRILYINPAATIKINEGVHMTIGGEYIQR